MQRLRLFGSLAIRRMTAVIASKLLAIFLRVALGDVAGRMRWLGGAGQDPARVLGNAAL